MKVREVARSAVPSRSALRRAAALAAVLALVAALGGRVSVPGGAPASQPRGHATIGHGVAGGNGSADLASASGPHAPRVGFEHATPAAPASQGSSRRALAGRTPPLSEGRLAAASTGHTADWAPLYAARSSRTRGSPARA